MRENYDALRGTEIVICLDNRKDLGSILKGRHKPHLRGNTILNRLI